MRINRPFLGLFLASLALSAALGAALLYSGIPAEAQTAQQAAQAQALPPEQSSLTAAVDSPSGGLVSGSVNLTAHTNIAARSLEFTIVINVNGVGSTQTPIRGTSLDGGLHWVGDHAFESAAWPDGAEVTIAAHASGFDNSTADSSPVLVTVNNQPTQPGLTFTSWNPADNTEVGGAVRFRVTTSQAVTGLSFFTIVSGNKGGDSFRASSKDNLTWGSDLAWDTSGLDVGTSYDIFAQATISPTETVTSEAIHVRIKQLTTVTMREPSGTVVTGAVNLKATTSATVNGVNFVVTKADKTRTIIAASPTNSTKTEWAGDQPLDVSGLAVGSLVTILPQASDATNPVINGTPIRVQVGTSLTVTVYNPRDASIVAPGMITLVATTTQQVDGLVFHLTRKDTNEALDPNPVTAGSSDKLKWVADWKADFPDGTVIGIIASATLADGTNKDSPEKSFTIKSSTFVIRMDLPTHNSTVAGSVALKATTSGAVTSLTFLVTPSGQDQVSFTATGNATKTVWVGDTSLNTSGLAVGSTIDIIPQVVDVTGKTVNGATITVQVGAVQAPTVVVAEPRDASIVAPGKIMLVASTSQQVDSLVFNLSKKDDTGIAVLAPVAASSTDKQKWIAEWTADYPDGTAIIVAARATLAGVNTDSRETTFTIKAASTLVIKIVAPGNGATVAGSVALKATTPEAMNSLTFFVTPAGQAQTSITATGNATKMEWVSDTSLDTSKLAAGTWVEIFPQAVDAAGTAVRGSAIKVQVGAIQTLTVAVVNPRDTSVVAPGKIMLVASTSQQVDGLVFNLSKKDAAGIAALAPVTASSTDKQKWIAEWTADYPDGTAIIVAARATLAGVNTDSRETTFTIKTGATQQFTVVIQIPKDNSMVPPGVVPLSAVTSQPVDSLTFLIAQASQVIATIQASSADKKLWRADWTTDLPDGTVVSVRAQAKSTSTVSDSPSNTVVIKKDAELPLSVVVTMPPTGSKLAQIALLSATTSRKSDKVAFKISGSALVNGPIVLDAQPDTAGIIWTASWDTFKAPNGNFRLIATSVAGRQMADSSPVDFALTNQTQTQPPATVTVVIEAPKSGARLTGRAMLAAIASQKVDVLNFFMVPSQTAVGVEPLIIRAGSDSSGSKWVAEWDTTRSANDLYKVVARVILGGQRVGESPVVQVSVDNLVTTQPPTGTTTQPPTGTTTQPPTGTTTQPPTTGLFVKMLGPAGVVRGNILLNAAVGGRPTGVGFMIESVDGNGMKISKTAIFSRETNTWQVLLDTTRGPDGKYSVVAWATSADGGQVISQPVILAVANVVVGGGASPQTIVVIPPEVAKEAAKDMPTDTTALSAEQRPPATEQTTDGLDKECQDARIPAERCREWLARRPKAEECRRVGILTKEECMAYLQKKYGGQVPECAGQSQDACDAIMGRKIAGLISSSDLDQLNQAVSPLVGQVFRFVRPGAGALPSVPDQQSPAEEAGQEASPPIDQAITDNIPLLAEQEVALRVQASPEFGLAAEDTSHRAVPVVLMIDSDGDSLPDDVEVRLGTDPQDPDTDGDGYSDGEEIRGGYNPLGPGTLSESGIRLAPVDMAIISGSPIEQPNSFDEASPDLSVDAAEAFGTEDAPGGTQFSGTATPGDTVTIFIYSYLPLVMTTDADTDGNWTYTLDSSLTDGQHEAYVVVTDETGKIKEKSSPLSFFIAGAKAVTESDYFKPMPLLTSDLAEAPMNRLLYWYIGGGVLLILAALVISALIFFRPKKKTEWS
jgi:hypothetical protein